MPPSPIDLLGTPADAVRAVIVTALAYPVLLLILRVSGKRTLAKLNAFDLVITVALGSTLASAVTSADVPLATFAAAVAGLVGLQWLVARASVHRLGVRRAVKAAPTALVREGRFLHGAMSRARVTDSEVLQVVRQHGAASLSEVHAVVLETDGSMSVIRQGHHDPSALRDVPGWEPTTG